MNEHESITLKLKTAKDETVILALLKRVNEINRQKKFQAILNEVRRYNNSRFIELAETTKHRCSEQRICL
jgi:3-methyladenine DNA glycosylase AlkC